MRTRAARVVVTQPIPAPALERLRAARVEPIGPLFAEPPSAPSLAAAAVDADVLLCQLTDPVTADVLEAAPALRLVATIAAGHDNIDVGAAAARGITVTHTPGVLAAATADLAVGLMLAAARRLVEGDAMVREGRFPGWRLLQEPMGTDVSGATLGIVGLGSIGLEVARRCHHGFGMRVLFTGGGRDQAAVDAVAGVRVELGDLLAQADFVSLHAPLRVETRTLIDAAALVRMRRSAILINTGRGGLVDEEALVRALQDGTIAGAGLDVYEREPSVHPGLVQLRERVVLAPHVGSATTATRERMALMAVDGVLAHLRGERPDHALGT